MSEPTLQIDLSLAEARSLRALINQYPLSVVERAGLLTFYLDLTDTLAESAAEETHDVDPREFTMIDGKE